MPFEERTTQRASPWAIAGVELLTCGPEDLVVHKVFAGRDRDWVDVEGVVARQGAHLDRKMINSELRPLLELKDTVHDMDRLHAILDRDPS
ncbi:MAG: hypothetical protein ACRDRS_15915 [Pseudonocardiaceae bacterium]